jgi:hypothetical protein
MESGNNGAESNCFTAEEDTMKKVAVIVCLMTLSASLSFAAAEEEGAKFSIALGGGLTLPLNSGLSDNYKLGFNLGATVNIPVSSSLSVFIDGRFNSFRIKSGAYDFPPFVTLTGGGATILSIVGGIKYMFPTPGSIHFYVLAGLGLDSQSYKDVTGQLTVVISGSTMTISRTESFSSSSGLGIVLGPGLLVDLGPSFGIFGEIRYASCLGKTMLLPIVLGAQIKI